MSVSLSLKPPEFQRTKEDFTASLGKLRQLIEAKVHILQSPITEEQQVNDMNHFIIKMYDYCCDEVNKEYISFIPSD